MSSCSTWFKRPSLAIAIVLIFSGLALPASAANCLGVNPSSLQIQFPQKAVGTQSLVLDVVLSNICTDATKLNINNFTLNGVGGFKLLAGWYPQQLTKGQKMTYELAFAPTAAQSYVGTFTVNVGGYSPTVVTLLGTGTTPGAIGNWSTTSYNFGSIPVGTNSGPQTVTLSNTGTKGLTVQKVYADPPFAVTGYTINQVVKAGASLPLQISFNPSYTGSFNGALVVITNNLPATGVTLYGTGIAQSSFTITSFPTLPTSTLGAAYLANLQSINGAGTVSWYLAPGSILPAGLTLASTGSITGTVASTVTLGSYPFTVTATDSSLHSTSLQLTLPVAAATAAVCNNIDWDVRNTTTPLVPMTDLGTGTYFGVEGGLYQNGSNIMPAGHDADGVTFAQQIQPLDSNGNPSPTGKIGLMSIGMSVTYDNFQTFMLDATADLSVNRNLVFIPGAQPRIAAVRWASVTDPGWNTIFNYFLPQSGVTVNQVQVAWVELVDSQPSGTFPSDMASLTSHVESAVQNIHTLFPNVKLAFITPREYAAYSNGIPISGENDPEPYAYEAGYAMRNVILDQINGVPAMNYNPANGPVKAPWIAWGPYNWANGMIARSDGFVWTCNDFQGDGVHPSQSTLGTEKVSNMLMNFLKTSDAASPWFLAQP